MLIQGQPFNFPLIIFLTYVENTYGATESARVKRLEEDPNSLVSDLEDIISHLFSFLKNFFNVIKKKLGAVLGLH